MVMSPEIVDWLILIGGGERSAKKESLKIRLVLKKCYMRPAEETCDRQRKQGTTRQIAIIYAASDPKGNDAKTLCKP